MSILSKHFSKTADNSKDYCFSPPNYIFLKPTSQNILDFRSNLNYTICILILFLISWQPLLVRSFNTKLKRSMEPGFFNTLFVEQSTSIERFFCVYV